MTTSMPSTVPTRTGRAPVDGGELWYEIGGSGPAVVLAHPGSTDARVWDDEFTALLPTYTVVRFDARGHGRSTSIAGDHRPSEDLRALLEHLRIDEAVIVGNSLGGRTAIDLALEHPRLVAGLVLVGTGLSGYVWQDPFHLAWEEQVRADAAIALQTGEAAPLVETILRGVVDGPHRTPDQVDPALRSRVGEIVLQTLVTHYTNAGESLGPDAVHRLGALAVPVLVIVGSLDMDDLRAVADLIAEQVPGAQLLVAEGTGHLVQNELPAWFHRQVAAFLARCARPSPGSA